MQRHVKLFIYNKYLTASNYYNGFTFSNIEQRFLPSRVAADGSGNQKLDVTIFLTSSKMVSSSLDKLPASAADMKATIAWVLPLNYRVLTI